MDRGNLSKTSARACVMNDLLSKLSMMSWKWVFIREADEVKVFETFGGDLPVFASQPRVVTQKDRATDLTNVRQAALYV